MKKTLIIIALIMCINGLYAQIGIKRSLIVASAGSDYTESSSGTGTNKVYYITYNTGDDVYKAIFFPSNSNDAICIFTTMTFPKNQINGWISYMNSAYVKIDDSTWKDYSSGETHKFVNKGIAGVIYSYNKEIYDLSSFFE